MEENEEKTHSNIIENLQKLARQMAPVVELAQQLAPAVELAQQLAPVMEQMAPTIRASQAIYESFMSVQPIIHSAYVWNLQRIIRKKGIEPHMFPFPLEFNLKYLKDHSIQDLYHLAADALKQSENQELILETIEKIFSGKEDKEFILRLLSDYTNEDYYTSTYFLFYSDYLVTLEAERLADALIKSPNPSEALQSLIQSFDQFAIYEARLGSSISEKINYYKNQLKSIKGRIDKNSSISLHFSRIRNALLFLMLFIMESSVYLGDYTRDTIENFAKLYAERDLIAHGKKRTFSSEEATKYIIAFIAIVNMIEMNSGKDYPPIMFEVP